MATYTWNTGSGAFGTPTNWTPSGPPGTTDTAQFSSGSGTISGTGSVGTLLLTGGGPWTWSGALTSVTWTVNDLVTLSTGATWTLAGTPNSTGNYMVIGSGNAGSGMLTIVNGASLVSAQTASTVASALYVGSGGSSNAVGMLTVSGAGSTVNTGPNSVAVGQAGTGTLIVQSGASANFSTSDSSMIAALAVGRNAGGNGRVIVSGAGSILTAGGFVTIGRGGTGSLIVSNGAAMTGGSAATAPGGAYSIAIGDSSPVSQTFGGNGTALVASGGMLHSLSGLRIGADGSMGAVTADGVGSAILADTSITVGSATLRGGGVGSLTIQNGASVRSGTPANGSANVSIGNGTGASGQVMVTGAGSLLTTAGYRISIGTGNTTIPGGGSGTLSVLAGAHVLAGSSYTDTEAALAVGAASGGTGTLVVSGAGSQLMASGLVVIGGNNTGAGAVAGGTGTVTVSNGGLLQSGAITIESNSTLTVDQSSLVATGAIALAGGTADLFTLTNATAVSFGATGTLRVHAVTGSNTLGSFGYGDQVDVAAGTAVSLNGSVLTVGAGTINLGVAPANASYQLFADGSGGAVATLTPKTIGVYRFFDTHFGTHFYTADANEAAVVAATRSDLTPEGPGGIGLQAVSVAANDPNAAAVYRFNDSTNGTHFFTASASERDSLIAGRPDLQYEAGSTFYEHVVAQIGDTAVYRYFDNLHGTHFYTDSLTEKGTIDSTRSDLVYEGIGFYEPTRNA